jgi:hypothetical protein
VCLGLVERAIPKNSIWEGPLLDALTGWSPRAPSLTQLSMSCLEPSHGTQGEHEIPVVSMTCNSYCTFLL